MIPRSRTGFVTAYRPAAIFVSTSVRAPASAFILRGTAVCSTSFYATQPRCLYYNHSEGSRFLGKPSSTPSARHITRTHPAALDTAYKPLKSSSFHLVLAALAVGITALLFASPSANDFREQAPSRLAHDSDNMSSDALPGRPGNLTPEQDEALRKLWTRIYEVCGVAAADQPTPPPAAPAPRPVEEAKKSRFGMFSRKSKPEKAPEPSGNGTASTSSIKEGDPEDKYGQNKIFLETLASQSPDSIRSTIWSMVKSDNPDALVLRFLRARKWDVDKALVMLVSSMYWRAVDVKVDSDIILRGEAGMVEDETTASEGSDAQRVGRDFMAQMRMGKSLIHGVDNLGRPICLVRARLHKIGEACEESLERYTVFLIETARLLLTPPVDTATLVFDMTGFSLSNMDYVPVKFMIKCFEANFPESLGVVLVHKAPWLFQGIWRIIRGWLDPVVAAKVHFTNDLKSLEEYISLDRLPKELEGEEDWEYKYVEPVPGENDRMKDTVTRDRLRAEREALYKEYEAMTLRMLRSPTDQAVRKEREEMAGRLRTQYWQLDPYIRARSWYDRTGVLKDGQVNYYPERTKVGAANGVAEEKVVSPVEAAPAAAVPVNGAAA